MVVLIRMLLAPELISKVPVSSKVLPSSFKSVVGEIAVLSSIIK
jgi:hypothetical protein